MDRDRSVSGLASGVQMRRLVEAVWSKWSAYSTRGHRSRTNQYMGATKTTAGLLNLPDDVVNGLLRESVDVGGISGDVDSIRRSTRSYLYPPTYDLPQEKAQVIYALIRSMRPRLVLETGVGNGVSTAFVLSAIHRNNCGRLISVDNPPLWHFRDPRVGVLVPGTLRSPWKLVRGSSRQFLATMTSSEPTLDVFIHDSDHSYANMRFEFAAAWRHLRPGGWLVADDADDNDALVSLHEPA